MKVTESSLRLILERWKPRLGMDERWQIETRMYTDATWPKRRKGSVAEIEPNPGYFSAVLHVNTDAMARDGDTAEHIILHELVHIPLWRLSIIARDSLGDKQEALWRDLMEEAVETMTLALLAKNVNA